METDVIQGIQGSATNPQVDPKLCYNAKDETYLSTHSGRRFHFLAPRPEDIAIEDIAHQTGMKCRFGGAVTDFYSVAQHSVYVSRQVKGNWATRMAALIHDANEAYLPDLQRPIKRVFAEEWATLESPAEEAIYRHLMGDETLAQVDWAEVKRADNYLQVLEGRALLNNPSWAYEAHWNVHHDANIRDVDPDFVPMLPKTAKEFFIEEYGRLQLMDDIPDSYDYHLIEMSQYRLDQS
jgi:uncharacterized protein